MVSHLTIPLHLEVELRSNLGKTSKLWGLAALAQPQVRLMELESPFMIEFASMKESGSVGIGLLGAGTIGAEVFNQFSQREKQLRGSSGVGFKIKKVLVKDLEKERSVSIPLELLTTQLDMVIADPSVDVIVSLLGNADAEYEAILKALEAGKKVVTANKDVIAKRGQELLGMAKQNDAALYFEAAVAGGIQIVDNLITRYSPNRFDSVSAILNGTTNYILTRMTNDGIEFEQALLEAQKEGYAEPNPQSDIDGKDAAYKIAILASLAFRNGWVNPDEVSTKGVSSLEISDFEYAKEMGYVIKLIAYAQRNEGALDLWVSPTLVHKGHPLASVNGVTNGVLLSGNPVGQIKLEGLGAGPKPTSASILSDVLKAVQNGKPLQINLEDALIINPSDSIGRNYIRMTVLDKPGTTSAITKVLGDNQINIDEIRQLEEAIHADLADTVVLTGFSAQGQIEKAITEISSLDVCRKVSSVMRVIK